MQRNINHRIYIMLAMWVTVCAYKRMIENYSDGKEDEPRSLAFVEAFELLLVLLEYIEDINFEEIWRNRGEQGKWQHEGHAPHHEHD